MEAAGIAHAIRDTPMKVDDEIVEQDPLICHLQGFVEIDTGVASFEALLAAGEEDPEKEADTDAESREGHGFDAL